MRGGCAKIIRCLVMFLFSATLVTACSGIDKEVRKKQREGVIYQVPYQKAFQCVISTILKKGISIHKIDKENGFITTLPRQIRAEHYSYNIVIRYIDKRNTAISVICKWEISPGADIAFYGIPVAVAKFKIKKLEIELADAIREEIMKENIQEPDAAEI